MKAKPTRFMRIPFIVTGYQVTEENMDAVSKWCRGQVIRDAEAPFIRVPVNRPTNKRQTEAYVECWVLLSHTPRGEESFKVYTVEWLDKNFIVIPREIGDEEDRLDQADEEPPCCEKSRSEAIIPTQPTPKPVTFRAATT